MEPRLRLTDLDIPPEVAAALTEQGYDELWPSQEEAAPISAAGENLVVAIPTASGKSLIAYLALLKGAMLGRKGLYLVPLRALASEKFEDLKQAAKPLGLKVALAIGDLDESDPQLGRYDIVVATSEKADALFRHRADWLAKVGVVISDEVHLMNEPDRGPTLEVLLTRFKQLAPESQIVALSATIQNARELADWLGAKLVQTQWRPVKLHEGILFGKGVQFLDNRVHKVNSDLKDPTLALVQDSMRGEGQCLVFVNTRKSTEAVADKLRAVVAPHLSAEERAALKEIADKISKGVSEKDADGGQTKVERRLARCIESGTAFHHAGLRFPERVAVEGAFKKGLLKALTATPTLAAGINLPARRVIIRDLRRFDSNEGNVPIPVLDYKQMAGRAGRPRYDTVGEAITLSKSLEEKEEILLSYLLADPERVWSKLGSESALRTHLLASIATGYVTNEAGLQAFVKHTFLAHQSEMWQLESRMTDVIDFLLENDLILSTKDKLKATPFGKRVSELYIDPLSAVKLRAAVTKAGEKIETGGRPGEEGGVDDIAYLHALCATPDMRVLYMRRGDAWVEAEAAAFESDLLLRPESGANYEYFLGELKTALLLDDWMNEKTEEEMLEKYNAYPGDILNKVDTGEWLAYAMHEIARIYEKRALKDIAKLRARLRHGAKAELLPLLKFRGVGRTRARQLFNHQYRSARDIAKTDAVRLMQIPGIGPGLAASILREAGADERQVAAARNTPVEPEVKEVDAESSGASSGSGSGTTTRGQASLGDFGGG